MENIIFENKFYEYKNVLCDDGTLCHISFLPKGYERQLDVEKTRKRYWPYALESMVNLNGDSFQTPHGKKHNFTLCSKRSVFKEKTERVIEGGIDHIITMEDPETGVLTHLHYEVYEESPAIVRYTVLENASKKPVLVTHLASFNMGNFPYFEDNDTSTFIHTFRSSWCYEGNHYINSLNELEVYSRCSRTGFTVESTGTWVCQDYLPFFIIEQRNADLFTAIQIEISSSWRFEFGIGEAGFDNWFYAQGGLGSEKYSQWAPTLKPGEKIQSPKASISVATGCYENVTNNMHTHRAKVLINRSQGDSDLPVIYNDWMYLEGKNTEESIIKQLDTLKEVGVDVFVTDAGWFCDSDYSNERSIIWPMTGHYEYNKERFPNGIKYVADEIKKRGMRAGIWCEIECLGKYSEFFEDKEMLLMRGDYFVTDDNHRFLNFTSPKVIEYADKLFDRFVEWGFEYVKIDYNSDSAPGADNCGSDSIGHGLYLNRLAYDSWLKGVRERHPQLIIESCSSGGMRLEYNSLAIADMTSMTDQNRFEMLGAMIYNVEKAIHPSQCGVWSYTEKTTNDNEFALALSNSMLGRMHLSGDFFSLSPTRKKILLDAVELYKKYRHILNDCFVFHHSGLIYCYKTYEKIISLELRSPNGEERVIMLQRVDCEQTDVHISIENLPEGQYGIETFPFDSKESISSQELSNGLDFHLPERNSAIICYIYKER